MSNHGQSRALFSPGPALFSWAQAPQFARNLTESFAGDRRNWAALGLVKGIIKLAIPMELESSAVADPEAGADRFLTEVFFARLSFGTSVAVLEA